jgi:hypothetical protein
MKKGLALFLIAAVLCSFILLSDAQAQKMATFPFYVYKDKMSRLNHYIPSGWMGDNRAVKLNDGWVNNVHSGKTCQRWEYTGEMTQGAGWAGVFWQNPANNWGKIKGGYDITGAKKLTLWARGEKGGEVVEFKVGGIMGEYCDTVEATTGPVELTKDWKQYIIGLEGQDLSYVGGGFCWISSSVDAPEEGIIFYLDDIVYEQ